MLDVECKVLDAKSYAMHVQCSQRVLSAEAEQDTAVRPIAEKQYMWEGRWGEEKVLQLP